MSDYTALLPPLSADEYEALKADIADRGCLVPVEVDEDGHILDGAHRLRACEELGIQAPTITRRGFSEDEKRAHAIALNLQRRQLSREGRAKLHRELRSLGKSLREIASISKVDKGTVRNDLRGGEVSPPATVTGRDGKTYPATKLKPAPVLDFPEAVTRKDHERHERREALRAAPPAPPPELPEGEFSVLYVDPPWRYDHSATPDLRAVENQYPTMTLEDLRALPIPAAPDAVLFMWATSPKLAEAIDLMGVWGFDYRTCMVWVKDRIGMGYYARQRHELLLIGKRGDVPAPAEQSRPDSVIEAPRGRHSEKPELAAELIVAMYPNLPRVELFARREHPDWTTWGNEVAA